MNSFDKLSDQQLVAHLGVKRYGDFILTEAVRPAYDLKVVPRQGYRHDTYHDDHTKASVPVLMGAASNDQLFEIFMELLDPLGFTVDVVLETSHEINGAGHMDLYREHMDMPVLKSTLWDFEDMLVNDGCTGIAVLNPSVPLEVQFDEHKLLIVYGSDLTPFERTFADWNVQQQEDMKFITEAEHVHSTSDEYSRKFDELKTRLGMDSAFA